MGMRHCICYGPPSWIWILPIRNDSLDIGAETETGDWETFGIAWSLGYGAPEQGSRFICLCEGSISSGYDYSSVRSRMTSLGCALLRSVQVSFFLFFWLTDKQWEQCVDVPFQTHLLNLTSTWFESSEITKCCRAPEHWLGREYASLKEGVWGIKDTSTQSHHIKPKTFNNNSMIFCFYIFKCVMQWLGRCLEFSFAFM